MACRMLTTKYISIADVSQFDRYIIDFCKGIERLYGSSVVTPNMHMHCHLSQCVLDYGPNYSFWLFSFERYNGHFGSMPNNSRAIEMQLMRRFLRDSFVHSSEFPSLYNDEFKKHFPTVVSETVHSDVDILRIMYMSKRSALIIGQDWQISSVFECNKSSCHVFCSEDYAMLKKHIVICIPVIMNTLIVCLSLLENVLQLLLGEKCLDRISLVTSAPLILWHTGMIMMGKSSVT